MKNKKVFGGRVQFKADGQPGEFRAVFATFNVVDKDGDITVPGAFKESQQVRIASWNHGWENLPVGRGEIHQDQTEAWVEGQFFLQTAAGKEHYETIKALDELGEWSYGFRIEKWSMQQQEAGTNGPAMQARILEKLDVIEVSPVMQGAGIGTHTADIKIGRRHSAADDGDIQAAHDALVRLGAKCGEEEDNADEDEGEGKAETGQPRKAGQSPSVFKLRIEIMGIAYE